MKVQYVDQAIWMFFSGSWVEPIYPLKIICFWKVFKIVSWRFIILTIFKWFENYLCLYTININKRIKSLDFTGVSIANITW